MLAAEAACPPSRPVLRGDALEHAGPRAWPQAGSPHPAGGRPQPCPPAVQTQGWPLPPQQRPPRVRWRRRLLRVPRPRPQLLVPRQPRSQRLEWRLGQQLPLMRQRLLARWQN